MTSIVKLLIVGVAIWFGLRLYRQWKLNQGGLQPPRDPDAFERMVQCRSCGVHLPASAVSASGQCGKCNS